MFRDASRYAPQGANLLKWEVSVGKKSVRLQHQTAGMAEGMDKVFTRNVTLQQSTTTHMVLCYTFTQMDFPNVSAFILHNLHSAKNVSHHFNTR